MRRPEHDDLIRQEVSWGRRRIERAECALSDVEMIESLEELQRSVAHALELLKLGIRTDALGNWIRTPVGGRRQP